MAIWPECRAFLNMNDSSEKQMQAIEEWLKTKLAAHITHRGSFKTSKDNHLTEEDFIKVYDLIECYTNAKLFTSIKEADAQRKPLFK